MKEKKSLINKGIFSRGFSLVEMLVIITIIGILTAISFSTYFTLRKTRNVKIGAEKVRDIILQSRSYALSPLENSTGYIQVTLTPAGTNPASISVRQYKSETEQLSIISDINTNLPTGLDFEAEYKVKFDASQPNKIGQLKSDSNTDVIIKNNDNSIKYQLKIDSVSGNVEIKKI